MDIAQLKKEKLRELLQEKFFAGDSKKNSVLIFGLGVHGGGVGTARFFAYLGFSVTVTDLKTKKELASSIRALNGLSIKYVLGKHQFKDIEKADLIIKNPGVSDSSIYIQKAKKLGIPITNDGAIFLALAPREHIIAVTGTKGKTTTSLLIKHLLGARAISVGTPGISFFDYFYTKRSSQWIVAEFSSFDLEYIKNSAHIVIISSLFPDHLNRYRSFDAYAKVKMRLLTYQHKNDKAFLWQSPIIKKYSEISKPKCKITWVTKLLNPKNISWCLTPEAVALAMSIAKNLGVPKNTLNYKLATFKAPPGRLEIVAKKHGSIFINDTTATNPGAAMHSIEMLAGAFDKRLPITIITGGEDKKFPETAIQEYAQTIKKHKIHVIIIPGSFSNKLKKMLTDYEVAETLPKAVTKASTVASVVALIPGAASFNMFKNEFDRGEQFTKAVHTIKFS